MQITANVADKVSVYFYFVFRLVIGGIFLLAGLQKIPGIMDGTVAFGSLMFFAFLLEVIIGPLVILGLLTREAALVGAVEMLVAYFMFHLPQGWNPIANQGMPALLFFAAFLALFACGAGKWSLDKVLSH